MRIESSSNILRMKLMKTNTDFARHLGRFFTYYLPHERNLSPNTIESYREAFVQLVCYYRDVLSIKVEKFTLNKLVSLRGTIGLPPSTRSFIICSMRMSEGWMNGRR